MRWIKLKVIIFICVLLIFCINVSANEINVSFAIIDETNTLNQEQLAKLLSLIDYYHQESNYFAKIKVVENFNGNHNIPKGNTIQIIIDKENQEAFLFGQDSLMAKIGNINLSFERKLQNKHLYVAIRDELLEMMGLLTPDSKLPVYLVSLLLE